jgi:UDP-N-acetylmuramoyl-L-alanyl-D-glutamate--2,6-diaminopimelate ligase
MKLKDLIKGIPVIQVKGSLEVEVSGIGYDSRKAAPGELFVCIPGTKDDGHKYVAQARERGVVGFLAGREVEAEAAQAVVVVEEPRLQMGKLASRLAGEPSRNMELVAITGTNGKTTISYLVESVTKAQGRECGVIGTITHRWKGREVQSNNTTPESTDVIAFLSQMRSAGVSRVAMEVSSHALDQKRVAGIAFRAGIFTNLTPEHLDYHKTMENYFQAKAKLFTEVLPGKWLVDKIDYEPVASINLDDEYGQRLFKIASGKKAGYALNSPANYKGELLSHGWDGIQLKMTCPDGQLILKSPLLGRINAYNILAAGSALLELGVRPEHLIKGVETLCQVPGRMERVDNGRGILALVDYAHTPDALENAVAIAKELKKNRLILVFGCGGDRDRTKRPKMGEIGALNAELLIVTSDNPRTEDPQKIIEEIVPGVEKTGFKKLARLDHDGSGWMVEPDRRAAIELALSAAAEGDCVLIAGKGHEDYQIVGTTKSHFDDREEVRRVLGARGTR